jgi:hypothetical protein
MNRLEIVDTDNTAARLAAGYATQPNEVAQKCLEQLKDLDIQLIQDGSVTWTTYVSVIFKLCDLHLKAYAAVFAQSNGVEQGIALVEQDLEEKFLNTLIGQYISDDEDVVSGAIAQTLAKLEEIELDRVSGVIGWKDYLLEMRRASFASYKAMEIVSVVKTEN